MLGSPQEPSPHIALPLGTLSTAGAEMLQAPGKLTKGVGLGTKFKGAKLEPTFLAVVGARHVLGHPGTLEVPAAPALIGCRSVHPLSTSAQAAAGFQSSLLFMVSSQWVLGFQAIIGLIVSPNSNVEVPTAQYLRM